MMLRPIQKPNASFYMHAMQHAIMLLRFAVQRGRTQTRGQLFYAPESVKRVRVFFARGWMRDHTRKKGDAASVRVVYVGFTACGSTG